MIGRLKGSVIEKTTSMVLLEVGGVAYELEVPIQTAFAITENSQDVVLYTHFVVREDAQLLFGFLRKSDRDMFRTLIKVNGVGPKLGVAILSGLDSSALVRCVQDDDVSTLVKLPGIGKKTAERLLIELRDKVKQLGVSPDQGAGHEQVSAQSIEAEAEEALMALGYKAQDAAKAVKAVSTEASSVEALIKAALKNML